MRKMPWVMYLWPGVPQLWRYGSWAGLVIAVSVAAIFDLLLLGSFGWTELIARHIRMSIWVVCGLGWLVAVIWSTRAYRRQTALMTSTAGQDVYGEALNHYLRGDYFQAERLFQALLRLNSRDVDARLMLATLLRHTGRGEEALQHLEILERFEGAAKWALEIEHERELLTAVRVQKNAAATSEPQVATHAA